MKKKSKKKKKKCRIKKSLKHSLLELIIGIILMGSGIYIEVSLNRADSEESYKEMQALKAQNTAIEKDLKELKQIIQCNN